MSTLLQQLSANITEARYAQNSEALFWDFVRAADWTNDHDYKRIRDMIEHLGQNKAVELMKVYDKLSGDLYNHLDDVIEGVSDDGFSDLVSHIVGSGKEVYHDVMEDPRFAQDIVDRNQYEEGFQYIWHILYDKGWVDRGW